MDNTPTSSLLGFNGERRGPVQGGYHLGNGYRMYSPTLRRFTAPDDMSPFGAGGINPYAYCEGDPINHTDPTGHFNLTTVRNIIGIAEDVVTDGGLLLENDEAIAVRRGQHVASHAYEQRSFHASMSTVEDDGKQVSREVNWPERGVIASFSEYNVNTEQFYNGCTPYSKISKKFKDIYDELDGLSNNEFHQVFIRDIKKVNKIKKIRKYVIDGYSLIDAGSAGEITRLLIARNNSSLFNKMKEEAGLRFSAMQRDKIYMQKNISDNAHRDIKKIGRYVPNDVMWRWGNVTRSV